MVARSAHQGFRVHGGASGQREGEVEVALLQRFGGGEPFARLKDEVSLVGIRCRCE